MDHQKEMLIKSFARFLTNLKDMEILELFEHMSYQNMFNIYVLLSARFNQ